MRFIAPTARILLGLTFVIFSANFFHPFLPQPSTPMPPEAMAFAGALMTSKLLTLVKIIEMAAGLALLANRAVPLALALLAPIIVGIVFFHTMLAPAGIGLALFILVLELVAAWSYRGAFKPMLQLNVKPDPVAHTVRVAPLAAA
ncbi:MAG TPA: hypothetical protein VGM90_32215 [Kofleriaceae bacterium]|jgi:uncharacterized membrane protein YphA (DoxX/SURF4 family)